MPDITMCTATALGCPVALRCHRNPASGTKPGDLQVWADFQPSLGAACDGFWSTNKDAAVYVTPLERGPSPEESELSGTPIIDDWQILAYRSNDGSKHHAVRGYVSGDSRWPNGHEIRTSIIAAIAPRRQWVRTRNTLYRLGCPHSKMPLIVEIACQPTWEQAWEHACASMGRHTVSEFIWKTATTYDGNPDRRRVRAALMREDLDRAGRGFVAGAWRLLSVTDATDTNAVAVIYDRMCQVIGSDQTPTASDVIDGWSMMSLGKTGDVDLTDPVAAAHKLGDSHSEKAMPLIIRMASAPDAIAAARIFLSAVRIPAALCETSKPAALTDPATMRQAAQSMLEAYGDGKNDDLFYGLSLLALRTDDAKGIDQVRTTLHLAYDSIDKHAGEMMIYRAWRELVASFGLTPPADPDDPIASAHALVRGWGTHALRELMEDDLDIPADGPRGVEPNGVMVLAKVGGTTETSSGKEAVREFKAIAGRRLPLARANDISGARAKLREEFPHLHSAIDVLLSDLKEAEPIRFRPTLLCGLSGGGKSRIIRRLAEAFNVGLHRYDGAGSGDNAFGGTPRRWSTGEHAVPLEAIRRHTIANPIVMVDEIDKAAQRGNNGSLANALLPFLSPETAADFPDPFVQIECNLSHVSYLLTANDDTALPSPLRDRLRVVRIPEPTLDHMIPLARGIVADLARENGGDERWYPDLSDGELAIVETLWPCGGSVRRLRAIVERIVARRETNPRN